MFSMSTQHRRCRSITSMMNARQAANQGGLLGGMTVLSIMVTAYEVRWNRVEERIDSHPTEARQLDEHGRTVLYKTLSRRMDDSPSAQVIRKLVEADPSVVWEGIVDLYGDDPGNNSNGEARQTRNRPREGSDFTNSPLIVAAWRRANLDILQSLVQGRPSVPSHDIAALVALWNSYRDQYHGSEEELVALLFEGGREAFAVFSKLDCLLSYCTSSGKRLVPWAAGGGSLHRAVSVPQCSVKLLQVILQRFPEQIRQQDEIGRLPLHSLLLTPSLQDVKEARWGQHLKLDRLKVLLEIHPQATMHRDANGQLPLHIAIASRWDYPRLGQLVQAFPRSIAELDEISGFYPFQLAATENSSLTTIFTLLVSAPSLLAKKVPVPPRVRTTDRSRVTMPSDRSKATAPPSFTGTSNNDVVTDELKALLLHVKSIINDDEIWRELQQLLRFEPTSASGDAGAAEWLALHAAVTITECPIGFIRVLIHMHPEQLVQQDRRMGRTPLHYAAANSAKSLLATTPPIATIISTVTTSDDTDTIAGNGIGDDAPNNIDDRNEDDDASNNEGEEEEHADLRNLRLQAVLDANHSAAQLYDNAGQLPLHLAAYQGMPAACLESLILAWPDALCRRDGKHSLYPFLLAACSPATALNEVFGLLVRAPHVLAAARGLVD